MLKISDLSRRTGVSVATIHFYMREGLLPPPTLKTSRNMAYYDESFVARIRFIRGLQEERRLPLRVIHSLLAGARAGDEGVYPSLVQLEAIAVSARQSQTSGETLTRAQVIERTRVDPRDLDDLIELGIVTSDGSGDGASFGPIDVAMSQTIASARALGLSRSLFPASDLAIYQRALSKLVAEEVPLFARRVRGVNLDLPPEKVLEGAVQLMGQFITQLRQKLILDLMSGIGVHGDAPALAPAPAKTRPKAKAKQVVRGSRKSRDRA